MKMFTQILSAFAAIALFGGSAFAAEEVAAGKIKSVNAEKKEFLLTDSAGKDWTMKLGDTVLINRGGKEVQNDLMVGDAVNVCYDKGTFNWTAHYILVQEGSTKDATLVHGNFKNYDADKKELTFTDGNSKDWNFPVSNVKLELNGKTSTIDAFKIGDHALAILEKSGDVVTLKTVMIYRK